MTEPFVIKKGGLKVKGEFKAGSPMVVFSHGFGVKRDSRGMFTDIANSLPDKWGYILFDYNDIDRNNVHLRPYSSQVKILSAVVEYAKNVSKAIYLIGHSMGCVTISLLKSSEPQKIILLAPPTHKKRALGKISWEDRPGARWEGEVLVVPRKDGTTSLIPKSFFVESHDTDTIETIQRYSDAHKLSVIQAIEEDVLSDIEGYGELGQTKGIDFVKIHGNHNFDSPHRDELVETILDILTS